MISTQLETPDLTFRLDKEYNEILSEIDFECSLCHAVQVDVSQLSSKMAALYHWITNKTKSQRNLEATRRNWMAALVIATEIRQAVLIKKDFHRLSGIDKTDVEETYAAIKERVEFLFEWGSV